MPQTCGRSTQISNRSSVAQDPDCQLRANGKLGKVLHTSRQGRAIAIRWRETRIRVCQIPDSTRFCGVTYTQA